MSAIRRQKIERLIEHAKTIEPKLKERIKTEMQKEISENYKYYDEKPDIDETELSERLKDAVRQELRNFALKEFPENNPKTLREYTERAMIQIEPKGNVD